MAIWDIFSKRAQRAKQTMPDVFQYDSMPDKLRVQLIHILRDTIGRWRDHAWQTNQEKSNRLYTKIHDIIAREYGVFQLVKTAENPEDALCNFILTEPNVDKVLDIPELAFRAREHDQQTGNPSHAPTEPINELIAEFNVRCREAAFGYAYEAGQIIRVDSTLTHQEITKPAIALLQDPQFSGANEEFLLAHENYRHGRHKEAIVEALKAFESTIKTIAAKRKWRLNKTPNAKSLIDACFANGLLDRMFESYLTGVRTSLESGLPTVRYQVAGHGQGSAPVTIPSYLAAFAINQAATSIIMLVEAHKHKK